MKQIVIMLTSLAITVGAMAAPRNIVVGHVRAPHTVVMVRPAYYGFYRPYFSPYFGYNPFYSPFAYGYDRVPSKLELKIEEINNDYGQQIAEVRHNKSLSRSERRSEIRDLRHERENSIIYAKRNFYHPAAKETDNEKDDVISAQ